MSVSRRRGTWGLAGAVALALAAAALPATAADRAGRPDLPPWAQRQVRAAVTGTNGWAHAARLAAREPDEGGESPEEIAEQAEQYAWARTAPALTAPAGALAAARREAAALPVVRSRWRELTRQPLDAEPPGFTDPVWSNAGAGFGLVSGRATAITASRGAVYAGAADGGVWRTTDAGRRWRPVFDRGTSISVGALLTTRDRSVWLGTGEANTSSDAYSGQGVYRTSNGGRSWRKVGGTALDGAEVYRLVRDGRGGVLAATTRGLYRTSDRGNRPWQRVLAPVSGNGPYDNHVTDVAVQPGTRGRVVLAVAAWRSGAPYNGFYLSTRFGRPGTFAKFTPSGDVDAADVGRTTLAWTRDGSALYALVQSPRLLAAGADTNLQGLFKVTGGSPRGPYTKIADSASLGASGSALKDLEGYHVGVQAWYNQALAVDPANPRHVYVSLEEVFETRDGGSSFTTASPYWNLGLSCGDTCPKTTHPDQHALLVRGGQVWIGNDGGLFRRPLSASGYGRWRNLNAGLRTLQYYGAGTGPIGRTSTAFWGGLQDNGTSMLVGRGAPRNLEPAGGDGGNVLVDPVDGTNAVGEYVFLDLYLTTDGGHSFRDIRPPDSDAGLARFIAPFVADAADPKHWVAGGQHIWDDTAAWQTVCDDKSCDWKSVHDLGNGNVATALAVNGTTTYAAWVGGGGNPGPDFVSGIDTNAGGTWHRITAPQLPQRYIAGLQVDPANPAHVFAVYNGYSRRWIDGGGVGHVFESRDGGATWKNVSGNLPDVGGDDLLVTRSRLVLATDVGVFVSERSAPARWSRRGTALPNTSVNDLTMTPNGRQVVAATHGRGLWTTPTP
jgi:hypothetical protein